MQCYVYGGGGGEAFIISSKPQCLFPLSPAWRCLVKGMNAIVEVQTQRPVALELYKDYKELGRFMLRYVGSTIAAGVVTEVEEELMHSKCSRSIGNVCLYAVCCPYSGVSPSLYHETCRYLKGTLCNVLSSLLPQINVSKKKSWD